MCEKTVKQLRTRLADFSYRQNSLVPSCAFLLQPSCALEAQNKGGGGVTFKSDLKERVKFEQEESVEGGGDAPERPSI